MSPVIFRSTKEMIHWSRTQRAMGRRIGFVPTMGALHEGHASLLIEAAKRSEAVILSIFVNPTQFAPGEDFDRYPRTWESDLEMASAHGVQAVFAPDSQFYPAGYRTTVRIPEWNSVLEGDIRPGHFDGVTSVVTKLFHATDPDVAVFGQKDAQQALLVRRMVRDLDFPLELVVAPTIREPDGLAKSSRNRYLSVEERSRAVVLSQALAATQSLWASGERSPRALLQAGLEVLRARPADSLDYWTMLDPDTLNVLDNEPALTAPAIVVLAARYGATRLLDNICLGDVW